jgi:putative hydrolase of the HAD superfamily
MMTELSEEICDAKGYIMIKAVIFDIDNTLYSYDDGNTYGMERLFSYAFEHFKIGKDEFLLKYKLAQKTVEKRLGKKCAAIHNRLIRMETVLELLEKPYFPHAINMYHSYWDGLLGVLKAEPGAVECINTLKKMGIKIGIGTDMTAYIQYKKIEKLGIGPLIDVLVVSEEVGVEKPDPYFFKVCVEKLGCYPEKCLFVGDNLIKDVKGALDSGMQACWYNPSEKYSDQITEIDREFLTIHHFDMLTGYINEHIQRC